MGIQKGDICHIGKKEEEYREKRSGQYKHITEECRKK
jgi:hypothetical protein